MIYEFCCSVAEMDVDKNMQDPKLDLGPKDPDFDISCNGTSESEVFVTNTSFDIPRLNVAFRATFPNPRVRYNTCQLLDVLMTHVKGD